MAFSSGVYLICEFMVKNQGNDANLKFSSWYPLFTKDREEPEVRNAH